MAVNLSVIVPAYNEEQRLPRMLDEALSFLEQRRRTNNFNYEVIIVDDGSQDQTTQCALKYADKFGRDRIQVITLEQNRGKGGAVREGVLASKGNYVMFADADGASKFSDLESLEKFMHQNEQSEFVVAVGSRAHMEKDAIAQRSMFRTILMKGFHLLVWTCCVRTVRDTQCGFKMFTRAAAHLLFNSYQNESWAFDVELLYLAEQTDCIIGEIPINWKEVDGSKIVPVLSWIRMGWDVICISILYRTGIYQVPKIKYTL